MPSATSRSVSVAAGLVVADPGADGAEHRAGVEAGVDAHDADPGLGVAGEDGPLDRRRAAPAGQEREVQVDQAERHRGEDRFGQQLPERDDDARR